MSEIAEKMVQWRGENEHKTMTVFDLQEIVGGAIAYQDYTGADFSNSNIVNANFQGSDFANAKFDFLDLVRVKMEECNFKGASFSSVFINQSSFAESSMSYATFNDCRFDNVDFADMATLEKTTLSDCNGSKIRFSVDDPREAGLVIDDSRFSDASFSNHMSGVSFNRSIFARAQMHKATFLDGEFDGCTFIDLSAKESTFLRMNVSDTSFEGTFSHCKLNLHGDQVTLDTCLLSECRLSDCELPGISANSASFIRCDMEACNFIQGDLGGAVFSGSQMTDCDFTSADISGTDFADTTLAVDFTKANASHASFNRAVLEDSIFDHADLFYARMVNVRLGSPEVLRGARLHETDIELADLNEDGLIPA